MTAAEFKKKWHRYTGKESAAYQEHFNDLCRLLGHPTPVEADPSGNDFFCFQKGVIKDAEFLGLDDSENERPKKGFADVWYKDHFGWEYKGKHKSLDEAYTQLQRYRESLLNPPLRSSATSTVISSAPTSTARSASRTSSPTTRLTGPKFSRCSGTSSTTPNSSSHNAPRRR